MTTDAMDGTSTADAELDESEPDESVPEDADQEDAASDDAASEESVPDDAAPEGEDAGKGKGKGKSAAKGSSASAARAKAKARTKARARPKPGRRAVIAAAAVAVSAAAVFAGVATWRYVDRDDATAHQAALRDQVAATAKQDVINLNTLDYRTVDEDLNRWQDSATGTLYAQITSGRSKLESETAKEKSVSRAAVLAVAVTELDGRAGKAAVMVTVRVTVTKPDGTAGATISRLIGQLSRTPAGWKMSGLSSAGGGA